MATTLLAGSMACGSGYKKPSGRIMIDPSTPLSIRLGYPLQPFQCGMLEDQHTRERTFYFANTHTGKLLQRYNDRGHLLQTVSLSAAVDSLGSVWSLVMCAPDSIFLFTAHAASYALIDSLGRVRCVRGLQDILVDSLGYSYELEPTVAGMYSTGSGLLFEARCNGQVPDSIDIDWNTHHRTYCSRIGRGAHLALLDLRTSKPEVTFGQYGYYNRVCANGSNEPREWIEGLGYSCLDGRIHHSSVYAPWIHVLDEWMHTADSFLVRLNEGDCHVDLPVLTDTELLHLQDSVDARVHTRNFVSTVSPCPPLHAVLVAIILGRDDERPYAPGREPEWAWVIHDTNGTRLGERRFGSGTYDSWCVLWNKDRAWVKRASTPQEKRQGLLYFDRLQLVR